MYCSRRETQMIRVKMSLSLLLSSSVGGSYDTFHGIKQSMQTQFFNIDYWSFDEKTFVKQSMISE